MYSLFLEPLNEAVRVEEMPAVGDFHQLGISDGAEADDAVSIRDGLEVY